MLRVQCPVCRGDTSATVLDGKLIVGQHANERDGECDGWGQKLDLPAGTSLSPDAPAGDRDGLSGFREF